MIVEAAKIIAQHGGDLYENYKGRNSYNLTTGVSFNSDSEFFKAIGDIMISEDENEREIVGVTLRSLKVDNLGKGLIYF
jgi:hypothetical protein